MTASARLRRILRQYVVVPSACLSLLVAIVVLVVAILDEKVGQIGIGGGRTVTLRGRPDSIVFRYRRPAGLPILDQHGRPIPERVEKSDDTTNLPPPKVRTMWPGLVFVHSVSAWNWSWLTASPLSDEEMAAVARDAPHTRLEDFWFGAPTWLVVLVTGGPPAWYFLVVHRPGRVRRYRENRGLCLACGYDLTGNTSGVCPECGAKCGDRI